MHVMMVVMMVMVMVMMVVVVLRRGHGGRGGRRGGFLRNGVTGEAERERGGRSKGLDHWTSSFC